MPDEITDPVLGTAGREPGSSASLDKQGSPSKPTEKTPEYDFGGDAYANFRLSLPEQYRDHSFFTKVKDFSDLANQAFNAHRMVGVDKLPAPKEDWTDDQWSELYGRLGRPEGPDKYGEVKLPPELDYKFDEAGLKEWDEVFHEMGLNQKQRDKMLAKYAGKITELTRAQQQQQAEEVKEMIGSLRREWGDNFEANLDMAEATLKKMLPEATVARIAGIPELANDPAFIKHFYQVYNSMKDDTARDPGDGFAGTRPFVGSKAQALQALKAFEDTHRDLIFTDPRTLIGEKAHLKEKREDLLRQRDELYHKAYPDDAA